MAPELVHKVALSGWLTFAEVKALSQTCRRMKTIFVDDEYGRNIHHALKGVVENAQAKNWVSARYAVTRQWCGEAGVEGVWRELVEAVFLTSKVVLESANDLEGWENVLLDALSLPGARGYLEMWNYGRNGYFVTSLLHEAAYVGSERVVDWVVERGGKLGVETDSRLTPFWVACEAGHLRVARKLVASGADVEKRDMDNQSALFIACRNGRLDVVEYLLGLGVFDVDERDEFGRGLLDVACLGGHMDVVNMLLEKGGAKLDVEGPDAFGLVTFACMGGSVEIIGLLVEKGVASGEMGKEGGAWERGLIMAARNRRLDVVSLLSGLGMGGESVVEEMRGRGWDDVVEALSGSVADVVGEGL